MNVMQKNLQNLIQCNITIIDISKDFSSHFFLSKKRLSESPVSVSTKQKTVFSGDNVNNVRGWIIYEMYISSVCRRVESYKNNYGF